MKKITHDFYAKDTTLVAQQLLGSYLIRVIDKQRRIGRIVEVEAYLGSHDLACHASKGITNRTEIMYGPPGYAYIYLIYGKYHCFNVVTEAKGQGSAVLIRALEPIENISMRTKGPGLLCQALQIDKTLNGQNLTSDSLYLSKPTIATSHTIVACPRIGVAYAQEWANKPLRFYIKDNPFISKKGPQDSLEFKSLPFL